MRPTAARSARRRPAGADAGRQTLQVERLAQAGPQFLAQGVFVLEFGHGVEAGVDGAALGQRGDDPFLQQAGAHRRRGPVHHRQQRAGPAAVAQRPRQFEAAARHLVEEEKAVADPRAQFREMSEIRFQGLAQVQQQRPGRGDARLMVVEAEAGQGGDAEVVREGGAGRVGVEGPVRPRRDGQVGQQLAQPRQQRPGLGRRPRRVGVQHLGRGEAAQLVGEFFTRNVRGVELAGGQVHPGGAGRPLAVAGRQRDEIIGPLRVEQRIFGEGARRDDAGDLALDQPLGQRGVLDLVADGDAMAGVQQPGEINFEVLRAEARHRDRLLAAGQRQAEDARADDGVVVEEFVEAAVLEEEQHPRMALLRLLVLLHHVLRHKSVFSGQHSTCPDVQRTTVDPRSDR